MKDLSIIILSYNTKKLTVDCLNSIIRNTSGIDYEIIVVDNASNDGSVEELDKISRLTGKTFNKNSIKIKDNKFSIRAKKKALNFILIKNSINVGFSRANNQGIKISRGKYVLLLNSDTLIKDSFLKDMVSWMDDNPQIGIASCALRNVDGSLQGTGGYFPYLSRVFAWMFFIDDIPFLNIFIKPFHPIHSHSPLYRGEVFYKKQRELDWVTGAFFMVRRKVFKDVGLFDVDYFMYTEDVDLCFRAKKEGWKVIYNPSWSIVHLGGASSTREFPIINEYKGIKLFYKKHMAPWQYPFLRILLKGGALLRMLSFGILKGGYSFKTYVKAFIFA